MRIPNDSKGITKWWKENQYTGYEIPVWACDGVTSLIPPEKGKLVCINPDTLVGDRKTILSTPSIWKYKKNGSQRRAVGCENRTYYTSENECWDAYVIRLQLQEKRLKKRLLQINEEINSSLTKIISLQNKKLKNRE